MKLKKLLNIPSSMLCCYLARSSHNFSFKRVPIYFLKSLPTFQEFEFSYISGMEYLEPQHNGLLILQERNIQNPDITELFYIFPEM